MNRPATIDVDVLIVGGGPMGLATAWRTGLASPGTTIAVLDKSSFQNDYGSSTGFSRQFFVQHAFKYMTELSLDSIPLWKELEVTAKKTLIKRVGALWFGTAQSKEMSGVTLASTLETLKDLDVAHTALTSADIKEKFPFVDFDDDYIGLFQKEGGSINLKGVIEALYTAASANPNVTLSEYEEVLKIEPRSKEAGGFYIQSSKGLYSAKKLVLAPGPYVIEILALLGLETPIDIWEMTQAYFKPTGDESYPIWCAFQDPTKNNVFYGFPEVDWGHPGYIRVCSDYPDRIFHDLSERTGAPSEDSLARIEKWVRDHMVGLDPQSHFTSSCIVAHCKDTNKQMILDNGPSGLPNYKDLVICSGGFSGRYIPIIGEIASNLVLTGDTRYKAYLPHFKVESWKPRKI